MPRQLEILQKFSNQEKSFCQVHNYIILINILA